MHVYVIELSESAFLPLRIDEKKEEFVSQGRRHPNAKLMQYLLLLSRIQIVKFHSEF